MTLALRTLSDAERFDWIRLSRSEGVGPRTFLRLLQRLGSAAAVLEALPSLARKSGLASVQIAPADAVRREIDRAQRLNLVFVALNEPAYPPALRVIDSPPPILTVRGNLPVLHRPMAAIVGSRNASAAGLILTERLARGLGEAGIVVVSGLARGIDAKAHRASLETGTVAVLAGGHERIYPADHDKLAAAIADVGAVVSEMPLEWEPRARDFPRRNRMVSGLALGTLVVEAAVRSGSLITARFAAEQGREVFAVPGSPLDARSEGTNQLLRQGATLCTHADDVVDALRSMVLPTREPAPPSRLDDDGDDWLPLEDDEAEEDKGQGGAADLLAFLGPTPIGVDELVRLSALPAAKVRILLTDLEIDGYVTRHPGDLVAATS